MLQRLQGVDILPAAPSSAADDGKDSGKGAMNIVRIIQAQEEERQRLARQMHDGPAQSLTNFILQAEICQRLFDRNPARAAEELDNLKTVASVTFQKVREFIFDLRPMMLDDLGVVPTVRRYVDSFREKNDIDVKLDIFGDERRLATHREVMIFRGIQELMAMARDYANPTSISIRLELGNTVGENLGRGQRTRFRRRSRPERRRRLSRPARAKLDHPEGKIRVDPRLDDHPEQRVRRDRRCGSNYRSTTEALRCERDFSRSDRTIYLFAIWRSSLTLN